MRFHTAADFAGLAIRRVVSVFFSTFIACGTGAAQQPTKPKAPATAPAAKPADNGKCIGVLSAIGNSINLQKIGITVFGNELNKVPVELLADRQSRGRKNQRVPEQELVRAAHQLSEGRVRDA